MISCSHASTVFSPVSIYQKQKKSPIRIHVELFSFEYKKHHRKKWIAPLNLDFHPPFFRFFFVQFQVPFGTFYAISEDNDIWSCFVTRMHSAHIQKKAVSRKTHGGKKKMAEKNAVLLRLVYRECIKWNNVYVKAFINLTWSELVKRGYIPW